MNKDSEKEQKEDRTPDNIENQIEQSSAALGDSVSIHTFHNSYVKNIVPISNEDQVNDVLNVIDDISVKDCDLKERDEKIISVLNCILCSPKTEADESFYSTLKSITLTKASDQAITVMEKSKIIPNTDTNDFDVYPNEEYATLSMFAYDFSTYLDKDDLNLLSNTINELKKYISKKSNLVNCIGLDLIIQVFNKVNQDFRRNIIDLVMENDLLLNLNNCLRLYYELRTNKFFTDFKNELNPKINNILKMNDDYSDLIIDDSTDNLMNYIHDPYFGNYSLLLIYHNNKNNNDLLKDDKDSKNYYERIMTIANSYDFYRMTHSIVIG